MAAMRPQHPPDGIGVGVTGNTLTSEEEKGIIKRRHVEELMAAYSYEGERATTMALARLHCSPGPILTIPEDSDITALSEWAVKALASEMPKEVNAALNMLTVVSFHKSEFFLSDPAHKLFRELFDIVLRPLLPPGDAWHKLRRDDYGIQMSPSDADLERAKQEMTGGGIAYSPIFAPTEGMPLHTEQAACAANILRNVSGSPGQGFVPLLATPDYVAVMASCISPWPDHVEEDFDTLCCMLDVLRNCSRSINLMDCKLSRRGGADMPARLIEGLMFRLQATEDPGLVGVVAACLDSLGRIVASQMNSRNFLGYILNHSATLSSKIHQIMCTPNAPLVFAALRFLKWLAEAPHGPNQVDDGLVVIGYDNWLVHRLLMIAVDGPNLQDDHIGRIKEMRRLSASILWSVSMSPHTKLRLLPLQEKILEGALLEDPKYSEFFSKILQNLRPIFINRI